MLCRSCVFLVTKKVVQFQWNICCLWPNWGVGNLWGLVLCLYILPSIFFFLRSRAASALSRLRNFFFISLSSGALSCGPRGSPLCGLGNTGRTLTLWKGILLYLELIVSLSFWLPLFVYRRVDQLQYVRYNVSCCEIRSIPHCASVALNDGFLVY